MSLDTKCSEKLYIVVCHFSFEILIHVADATDHRSGLTIKEPSVLLFPNLIN